MILKGNQRGGGRQMALHLLNADQNEHVNIHEVSGFMAEDVLGALNEAYALSKGTKCKQFMYSLSLSPPQDEKVSIQTFEETLDRVEKKLKLEGQPRVIVFHEKEGRRHAHCVWSRIDSDEMKAINMSHDRKKLNDIAKSLYLEHGWKLPEGLRDKSRSNPLNFTRAELRQADRINRSPKDIKRELQECWNISDCKKSFENALSEYGYFLGKGDRRGYVAVDVYGEVYPLNQRKLGQDKKTLEARLGKADTLPSVSETKDKISKEVTSMFSKYQAELKDQHDKQTTPLRTEKQRLTKAHRQERKALEDAQQERWKGEEIKRTARIHPGFKGVLDKINGRYWKTRKRNEQETWQAHKRDQKQREDLIQKQLSERQNLQVRMNLLRQNQDTERTELIRDLSHIKDKKKSRVSERSRSHTRDHQNDIGIDDHDIDFEPEI